MKYKPSKYIMKFEYDNGEVIFYNTFTRNIIAIENEENLKEITRILESNLIHKLSSELESKMLQNGFLIEEEMMEKELLDARLNKVLYGNQQLDLTIIPTDACNFACIYCYQKEPYHVMTEEVEDSIIKFLERNVRYYKNLRVSWFGGEPLLEKKRIIRMMRKINECCRKNGVALVSRMTTNGYELDVDTFLELLNNKQIFYQITLDGTADTHNKRRYLKNGEGSFDTILHNLTAIRDIPIKKQFDITIRINVDTSISGCIDDFIQLYNQEFGQDKRFNLSIEMVRDWGGERIDKLKEDLISNQYEIIGGLFDKVDNTSQFTDYVVGTIDAWVCLASKTSGFVITQDGLVHKCPQALYQKENDFNNIGSLTTSGKMLLDNDKAAKWTHPNQVEECKDCKLFPLCYGLTCPYAVRFKNFSPCNQYENMVNVLKLHVSRLKDE